jgi:predicted dehydrogenase
MKQTRRQFLHQSMAAVAGSAVFPTIIPARVLGADAPSKKINILQIGCGRIAHAMDMPGILKQNAARIVAVCDLDSIRVKDAKDYVQGFYRRRDIKIDVTPFGDYRDALQQRDIDAVAISVPDHWHSELVVAAALAGKDIYVQKPLSMTLAEGRMVSNTVRTKGCMFQIGSQQRSTAQFRRACEYVRNGRIGKLHTVRIGLPTDPAGKDEPEMPVPSNLNYPMWLGCTPLAPYTENRVHSQNPDPKKRYSERPGWLRIESYSLGMITGWGSHHVDTAHWGMDTELTGPISVEAKAEFPSSGLWNVHGPYHIEAKYANGVTMIIDNHFDNGIRFEGSEGWIFVTRIGQKVTESDPNSTGDLPPLIASNPEILNAPLGSKEIRLHASPKDDHHLDWITSIQTREPAVTSVEVAHRSGSACIIGWIAMRLGRKLAWNPEKEEFASDPKANEMRSRLQRAPYGINHMRLA